MKLGQDMLEKILSRVASICSPSKVILFGSFATGSAGPDSDVDLLVVLPAVGDARALGARIRDSLQGLGVAFDVVVMATRRFEETKDVIGGIAYPAHKYGKIIHEAA